MGCQRAKRCPAVGDLEAEMRTVMMPKGQVKFIVGYCIFILIFTQFMQHSHRYEALLEPLAALFGSVLPISI
jgi:hypothetical protein